MAPKANRLYLKVASMTGHARICYLSPSGERAGRFRRPLHLR